MIVSSTYNIPDYEFGANNASVFHDYGCQIMTTKCSGYLRLKGQPFWVMQPVSDTSERTPDLCSGKIR